MKDKLTFVNVTNENEEPADSIVFYRFEDDPEEMERKLFIKPKIMENGDIQLIPANAFPDGKIKLLRIEVDYKLHYLAYDAEIMKLIKKDEAENGG